MLEHLTAIVVGRDPIAGLLQNRHHAAGIELRGVDQRHEIQTAGIVAGKKPDFLHHARDALLYENRFDARVGAEPELADEHDDLGRQQLLRIWSPGPRQSGDEVLARDLSCP